MSKIPETRFLVQHESCAVCNSKQKWNQDVDANVKNQLIGNLVKKITYGTLVPVIMSAIERVELVSI